MTQHETQTVAACNADLERLRLAVETKREAEQRYRFAFTMAVVHGVSPTRIAKVAGINRVTVYRRIDQVNRGSI